MQVDSHTSDHHISDGNEMVNLFISVACAIAGAYIAPNFLLNIFIEIKQTFPALSPEALKFLGQALASITFSALGYCTKLFIDWIRVRFRAWSNNRKKNSNNGN